MSELHRIGRRMTGLGLALAMLLSAALAAPAAALADPTAVPTGQLTPTQQQMSALQVRAQQVQAQISILDPQLEIATEEYNNAHEQWLSTTAQFEQAESALGTAQANLDAARQSFDGRLVTLYRSGQYSGLDLLLSTADLKDLVERLDFLAKMGDRDAETIQSLAKEAQDAETAKDQLAALQQQQMALELKAGQYKSQVEQQLQERQALLDSLGQQFRDLLAQQFKEQQGQQAALVADIRTNGAKYGIQLQPGSPVETALQYIGIPYVWGGDDPVNGFDCSGLVMYVMRQHGVELPHYSRAQAELGIPVTYDQLLAGDLVFFGGPIHHVGMYIGGGKYIQAPKTGDFVKISDLSDRGDFACARRYPWVYRSALGPTIPDQQGFTGQPPASSSTAGAGGE